jgi:hypothetical protein
VAVLYRLPSTLSSGSSSVVHEQYQYKRFCPPTFLPAAKSFRYTKRFLDVRAFPSIRVSFFFFFFRDPKTGKRRFVSVVPTSSAFVSCGTTGRLSGAPRESGLLLNTSGVTSP